ncbi:SRPBCC domain-containing protein [Streptomyces sp. NBC_00328]|uniref:SRPBCC domain-containing protein n=1 Tax=Streptomyces sp. NBC_00328 TaxID=2903646 RepID=UPI002E2CEECD|nr:SRPBCC domain-containing protein [Streptomyces sp. NBC_00328]
MSEDRIERETLIEAPLERVWPLVAVPGFWVADEESLPTTEGRAGESTVVKNAQYGEFPVRVEKVEPPTYVAYRWTSAFSGAPLSDGNSTLVEFTLIPEGASTRLRVVESGFAALAGSAELRHKAHEDNSNGWPQVLDAFKKRAAQSSV